MLFPSNLENINLQPRGRRQFYKPISSRAGLANHMEIVDQGMRLCGTAYDDDGNIRLQGPARLYFDFPDLIS